MSDVLAPGAECIRPSPVQSCVDARHIRGIACCQAGGRFRTLFLTDVEAMFADAGIDSLDPQASDMHPAV